MRETFPDYSCDIKKRRLLTKCDDGAAQLIVREMSTVCELSVSCP